jgi:hypothetical protein
LLLLLLPLHRKRNPQALSMTPFGDIKFHSGVSKKKTQKKPMTERKGKKLQ